MHWPLSREASEAEGQVQVPGWMDAQGKGPDAGQGKSGLSASGSWSPGLLRFCGHLYSPKQHTYLGAPHGLCRAPVLGHGKKG